MAAAPRRDSFFASAKCWHFVCSPPHCFLIFEFCISSRPRREKIPPGNFYSDLHAWFKNKRFASARCPLWRNWHFESRMGHILLTPSSPSGGQNSSDSSCFVSVWGHLRFSVHGTLAVRIWLHPENGFGASARRIFSLRQGASIRVATTSSTNISAGHSCRTHGSTQ